jgi:hypothetical protein
MSQFGNVVGTLRTIPMKLLYRALTVLFLLGLTSLHAAEPALSEIMPSNARILADEDGDFPDWIEIKNPGPGVT